MQEKFIQIAFSDSGDCLFALTNSGDIWKKESERGLWKIVVESRDEELGFDICLNCAENPNLVCHEHETKENPSAENPGCECRVCNGIKQKSAWEVIDGKEFEIKLVS